MTSRKTSRRTNSTRTKNPSTKARKVGRPRVGQERVGADLIVQKARELLRKHGTKISVREIARQLNINLSLIAYYFGSRKGLLTAVVHHIAEENRGRHREAAKSDLPAAEKIRRRIDDYLLIIEENPFFHELLIELVILNRNKKSTQIYDEITKEPIAELHEILKSSGMPHIDGRLLHVAILAMCEYTAVGKPIIDALFDGSQTKEFRASYRSFVSNLIIQGLRVQD